MVDFDAVKERQDLRAIVLGYTTLNKSNQGPCPFCNDGRDRFYIAGSGKVCACRKCGYKGDVIAFFAKVEGLSHLEAAKRLGSEDVAFVQSRRPVQATKQTTETPKAWKDQRWQGDALRTVQTAQQALVDGSAGFDYLRGRGLSRETSDAFGLGFARYLGRPAVVVPWFATEGTICAVKYRFIDGVAGEDKGRRFTQMPGSSPLIFGFSQLTGGGPTKTLIGIEGEFNALSIWQVTRSEGFDVLSVGAEGNVHGIEAIRKIVQRGGYQRVLLWFDDPERARSAWRIIPHSMPKQSPDGQDANSILTAVDAGAEILRMLVRGMLDDPLIDVEPARPETSDVRHSPGVLVYEPSMGVVDFEAIYGGPQRVMIAGKIREGIVICDPKGVEVYAWSDRVEASRVRCPEVRL